MHSADGGHSVAQGEAVSTLWWPLFDDDVHMGFAWPAFRWDSDAKSKALVHVVVIGFSTDLNNVGHPLLYGGSGARKVKNINGYLLAGDSISVTNRQTPLSDVPKIGIGNKLPDWDGHLFSAAGIEEFVRDEPASSQYFRPF